MDSSGTLFSCGGMGNFVLAYSKFYLNDGPLTKKVNRKHSSTNASMEPLRSRRVGAVDITGSLQREQKKNSIDFTYK